MFNFNQPPTIKKVDEKETALQTEIKSRAQRDAESKIAGFNPTDKYNKHSLRLDDTDYITKVEKLTQEFLNNPEYIKKITTEIENGKKLSTVASAHDEGYKSGRGVLEEHNKEHYGDDRKAA